MHLSLAVTLEELYEGCVKHIAYKRLIKCKTCHARGTKKIIDATCKTCSGKGQVIQRQQQGFAILQSVSTCPTCQGRGNDIKPKDQCKTCNAQCYIQEDKHLNIDIERGMHDGATIMSYGGANEDIKLSPGDIIITLHLIKHDQFDRIGNDLYCKQTITLLQALSGDAIAINHLNKQQYNVSVDNKDNTCDCVIQSHTYKKLPGHGMAIQNQPDCFGDLYIQFILQIDVTTSQKQAIVDLLHTAPRTNVNVLPLEHVDVLPRVEYTQQSYTPGDDEYQGHGAQPQCAQQ